MTSVHINRLCAATGCLCVFECSGSECVQAASVCSLFSVQSLTADVVLKIPHYVISLTDIIWNISDT